MTGQPGLRPAPVFTGEELDAQRRRAIALFLQERAQQGDAGYRQAFEDNRSLVERFFLGTDYLRHANGDVLAANRELLEVVRFLAGPPMSRDDLDVLVGRGVTARKRLRAELAQAALEVLQATVDTIRCPWLREQRDPSTAEIKEAIDWTAGLMTAEQLRTGRRPEPEKRQQEALVQLLRYHGWQEAPQRPIRALDDLPRGHFCRETDVWGMECDVAVRLHDGRLLALECRVSHSGTAFAKRLIREIAAKAFLWRAVGGQDGVITGAVLAGVYELKDLREAQNRDHVVLFWEHDLTRLMHFINP